MAKNASKTQLRAKAGLVLALVLINGILIAAFGPGMADAAELNTRSVALSTQIVSLIASENFQFQTPSTGTLGSIVFQYCNNSPVFSLTCNVPGGLDVSSANLSLQTGNTSFTIDTADTTANKLVITRTPAAASTILSTYKFDNTINPSTPGATTFVRITTYASTDGTGPSTDRGAVAFVTNVPFNIDAYVPPFLRFCVGITVSVDCSSVSGDSIDLGDLSPNHPSAGQSQFSTGTNDPNGYVVYATGTTMTSGNNVIPSLSSPTPSFFGNSQFGINLRADSNPQVGQEPTGAGTGIPTADYNSKNFFTFNSGDAVASSSLPTDYNRMTTSYLVNISRSQAPGVYSTTVSYIATVQF